MALATRCPHCGTRFRVAQDQLKLRAGLVRCGACKEIFNGIEHLLTRPSGTGEPQEPAAAVTPPDDSGTARLPTIGERPLPAAGPAPFPSAASATFSDGMAAREVTPSPDASSASTATPDAEPSTAWSASDSNADADANVDAATTGIDRQTDASSSTLPAADEDTGPLAPDPSRAAAEPLAGRAPFGGDSDAGRFAGETHAVPSDTLPRPDPLTRMTLLDVDRDGPNVPTMLRRPSEQQADAVADDEDVLGDAVESLRHRPWRKPAATRQSEQADPIDALDEAESEPEFVRRARRREQFQQRFGWLMTIGSVLLVLALLVQAAVAFRNPLAAQFPPLRPSLTALCKIAGCQLGLPMQIDALSIETNELQSLPDAADGLLLSALLRNRSSLPQAWPALELTLNDAADKPLARRVFLPAEYIGDAAAVRRGFPPNAEQPIKLPLLLQQIKPSGYRLYLFYP